MQPIIAIILLTNAVICLTHYSGKPTKAKSIENLLLFRC